MGFHEHKECEHTLKYCEKCKVWYCTKCGKEFYEKANWYYTTCTNAIPDYVTTCGDMYYHAGTSHTYSQENS